MSRENIGRAVVAAPNAAAVIPGENAPLRLLRLPEVISRVGLRRSSIYQRMAEGRFPKARSLGPRCAVWVETEIDAWIASVVGA